MSELSIAESIKQDYEEEINKQAKVIQWYEKENRHNQEIIIKQEKEINKLKEQIKDLKDYSLKLEIKNGKLEFEIWKISKKYVEETGNNLFGGDSE